MKHDMRRSINELLDSLEYIDEICSREAMYEDIHTIQIKKEIEEMVKKIELKEYEPGDVYNSPDLRRVRKRIGTASIGEWRA